MFQNTVTDFHNRVKSSFFTYMKKLEFNEIQPEPLIPRRDTSLLFTNSTTVPFKPYIFDSLDKGKGIYCHQPCLRLQSLRDYEQNLDEKCHYNMFFNMLGCYSSGTDLVQVADSLFTDVLGIENTRLSLHYREEDVVFFPYIDHIPASRRQLDQKPESFYTWVYGVTGATGVGLSFVMHMADGRYENLGQVIAIRKDGQLLGYEFGFGVETFLHALYCSDYVIDWAEHRNVADHSHSIPRIQLIDTLLSMALILRQKPRVYESNQHHGSAYNRLQRHVVRLILAKKCSPDDARSIFENACIYVGLPSDTGTQALALLEERISSYAANLQHLQEQIAELNLMIRQGELSISKAQKRLLTKSQSFPVLPEILDNLIRTLIETTS